MSDSDETCEYVLDPDDPETWGGEEGDECYVDEEVLNEEGVWTCPHGAEEGEDLCLLHLPSEQKDDGEAVNAFLDALDKANDTDSSEILERKLQFLGVRFGAFDLSDNPPEVEFEEGVIVLNHSKIDGKLDWSNPIIKMSSIRLRGLRVSGDADFRGTEFGGEADFRGADFRGDVRFGGSEIEEGPGFRRIYKTGASFDGDVNFLKVKFRKDTDFGGVTFYGGADFWMAEFSGEAVFSEAEFMRKADFKSVNFEKGADFYDTEFGNKTDFFAAQFDGDAGFWKTEFSGEVDFQEGEFNGDINFRGAEFNEGANFANLVLNRSQLAWADLTDATFTGTNLREANLESALLNRATLFDVDIRGARLSGAVLGDIQIDNDTKFLGYPSDDTDASLHTLSAIRSRPTCVYDPDYEEDNEYEDVDKAKSVYRALEELGGKHARPRLQARSFVRRKDLQKKDYWNAATADDAILEERLIAGTRWSRAKVARAILLYGESPWRVIAWSLGFIFSFAFLYPLGGWMKPTDGDPITYAQIATNPVEILNSVYYSTLTYTALGFGDFQPVGIGRLLTTLETGLGAVLLALLVFVLGRRAAR